MTETETETEKMTDGPAAPHRARTHLFFRRVRVEKRGALFSLELTPRLHAIVAKQRATADAFVRVACGIRLPSSGTVLLGHEAPGRSPTLRARIGSLLPDEPPLPDLASVRDYVAHVEHIRSAGSENANSDPERDVPFIASLLDRPTAGLSPQDRRQIALGLALSVQNPALLVLHDPLGGLNDDAKMATLGLLRQRAEAGTIVVCTTLTERVAAQLSDAVHHLEHPLLPASASVNFLVQSERPREVASLLARSDAVLATRVASERDLIVEAHTEQQGAEAITAALCASQVEVFEVRRVIASGQGDPSA